MANGSDLSEITRMSALKTPLDNQQSGNARPESSHRRNRDDNDDFSNEFFNGIDRLPSRYCFSFST